MNKRPFNYTKKGRFHPGRSRVFSRQRYYETGSFKTKTVAKDRARSWRITGHKARVVQVKHGKYKWHLFTRGK